MGTLENADLLQYPGTEDNDVDPASELRMSGTGFIALFRLD